MRRDGERKEEVQATSFLRALVLAPVLLGVKEVIISDIIYFRFVICLAIVVIVELRIVISIVVSFVREVVIIRVLIFVIAFTMVLTVLLS